MTKAQRHEGTRMGARRLLTSRGSRNAEREAGVVYPNNVAGARCNAPTRPITRRPPITKYELQITNAETPKRQKVEIRCRVGARGDGVFGAGERVAHDDAMIWHCSRAVAHRRCQPAESPLPNRLELLETSQKSPQSACQTSAFQTVYTLDTKIAVCRCGSVGSDGASLNQDIPHDHDVRFRGRPGIIYKPRSQVSWLSKANNPWRSHR